MSARVKKRFEPGKVTFECHWDGKGGMIPRPLCTPILSAPEYAKRYAYKATFTRLLPKFEAWQGNKIIK